ncbi:MAG: hypothetical protein EBZ48_04245 [Proteobacteria bacterium]|nr:hypothetical protein [Pseudomonadota bacterium]
MKIQDVAALVIDSSADGAKALVHTLEPELKFSFVDFTSSLRKALMSHTEESFQVCFLSEKFPPADTEAFFKDIKGVKSAAHCVFVQVREDIPAEFDPSPITALGFRAVISRKGTHDDKVRLIKVLEDTFYAREVKRRKLDVDSAMTKLLDEIDRAAIDIRRGVPRKLAAIRMDGIEIDTAFDPEVLESYFETLSQQTAEAEPRTIDKLKIPEKVLRKALPCLTAEGYTGASQRVWKILAARYGVKIGEDSPLRDGDNPAPEQVISEDQVTTEASVPASGAVAPDSGPAATTEPAKHDG